ncbi:MAG TPA: cell division protein FtsQ/DivIB [Sporosarcina sp.]|nr:cell division protein FtsQ/DivIB [Sporosarcina sp.]
MKKVIDIEDRIPSMREKRRKVANRKFISIIAVFIIALLIVLYFQSTFSKIDQISVEGFALYDEEDYIKKSQLASGDSLWGFSKEKIANNVAELPGVKEVTLERKWMRNVNMTVEEAEPIAYVQGEEDLQLLLSTGEVFENQFTFIDQHAPILSQFDKDDTLKQMATILQEIDSNVISLISEVAYTGTKEEPESITLYMDDGYEVHALLSTVAEKIDYYPDMVAQLDGDVKGVIDMEVGSYFIPYDQQYNSKDAKKGKKQLPTAEQEGEEVHD